MKPDEAIFLKACQAQCPPYSPGRDLKATRFPRDVYNESGLNGKRACAILDKWSSKGWYDYGVSVDLGWMTSKGMAVEVPVPEEG